MANMKTLLTILILVSALTSNAATNLLSLIQVNGTNTGNVTTIGNISIPVQRAIVQSLGITNTAHVGSTNRITVNFQISIDGSNTNWVTIHTFHPTTTNAVVDSVTIPATNISLPWRAQVITTNSLGVSVFTQ